MAESGQGSDHFSHATAERLATAAVRLNLEVKLRIDASGQTVL